MAEGTRGDTLLQEGKSVVKPPNYYKVLLLNDDYTPMEFVVSVLQKFFNMNPDKATRVMLKVHTEGQGVCGVFPRDVAATKVEQVLKFANPVELQK